MSERYKPERTVFVDMDNVIADFDAEAVRRVKLRDPEFRGDLPRTNFYIAEDYPGHEGLFREVFAEEGFFRSLPVVDGAIGGWQSIIDHGYQPRILSSPLSVNATCEVEKREWLSEKFAPVFGEHVAHDAIITKHKHVHKGVALIDDRPEIPDAGKALWSHIVMHYQHNEHIDTDLRLRGWRDPQLEFMLKTARDRYRRRLGARAL